MTTVLTVPAMEERRTGLSVHRGDEKMTPRVEFITKREHGFSPEQMAHWRTGRNARTGKLTLAIGVRRRRNGLVRFDGDLFRLPYDLTEDAISRLYRHWHDLNTACSLPKKVMRAMDCHFSRTTIIFDASAGQENPWRELLTALLTDPASYLAIAKPGEQAMRGAEVQP